MTVINMLLVKNLIKEQRKTLLQENIAIKSGIANFVKRTDFDNKMKI